ncbi:MAG: hypothetical protein V4520_18680 [Bacteroidota bacterium]
MENTEEQQKDETLFKPYTYQQVQGLKDWMFENMVTQINRKEEEIPMVINSNGIVLSGVLIGVREYFGLLLNTSAPTELSDKVASKEDIELNFKQGIAADYFHMKNASFVQSSGMFPKEGLLWRGKISEVNGFSSVKFEQRLEPLSSALLDQES